MTRRTFSKEKKLLILKEAKAEGVKKTLDKHGVYPATYYSWRKKYEQMGEKGMDYGMTKARLKQIRCLEKENATLKELLVEKDLKIKMQQEIIKKNRPLWEKRRR